MAATLGSPRFIVRLAGPLLLVSLAATGLAAGSVGEAPGPSFVPCALERIGTQLVRCDNLTGTGVEAPFWIPEQH